MSRLDHAIVMLDLDGEKYELRPTLRALRSISRQYGGIGSAMERVRAMDFDTVVNVVAAGAGIKDPSTIEDQIFQAGIVNAMPAVSQYLVGLLDPSGSQGDEESEGKAPA